MTFSSKVDETLAQAECGIADISSTPAIATAIQCILEAVQKGRAMKEEQQNLIRLADHSEHGWGVVEEYIVDDLAEDLEDEKQTKKAKRAA